MKSLFMLKLILSFIFLFMNSLYASEIEMLKAERSNYIGAEVFCQKPNDTNILGLYDHCYLRFVHNEDIYKDIAVNFQVQTMTGIYPIEAIPLLVGSYPMNMYVEKFPSLWERYVISGDVNAKRQILVLF